MSCVAGALFFIEIRVMLHHHHAQCSCNHGKLTDREHEKMIKNEKMKKMKKNEENENVDVCQCDDTIFSSRFEPEDCMRTFSSVRVSPHVCCQVYKVQVSVSNIVADATGSRVHNTSIHKYPPSVSCHVPRCSIPSQHISPVMRPNELPQNPISINTPLGDDDCNVFRLSGMSSHL